MAIQLRCHPHTPTPRTGIGAGEPRRASRYRHALADRAGPAAGVSARSTSARIDARCLARDPGRPPRRRVPPGTRPWSTADCRFPTVELAIYRCLGLLLRPTQPKHTLLNTASGRKHLRHGGRLYGIHQAVEHQPDYDRQTRSVSCVRLFIIREGERPPGRCGIVRRTAPAG